MFGSSYKQKLTDIYGQRPDILRALGIAWQAAPVWTILWAIVLIIEGLLPAAHVYLTKIVVDALLPAVGSLDDPAVLRPLLFYIALYGGVMFLGQLSRGLHLWIGQNQGLRIDDYTNALVQAKSAELDLAFFDSQHYYDLIHRAAQGGVSKPLEVLRSLGYLIQHMIALVSILGLLFSYGILIPIILVATVLPGIYLIARHSRIFHTWWEKTTIERRRAEYYKELLTRSEPAAELRLFSLANYFHSSWLRLRHKLRDEELTYARRHLLVNVAVAIVTMAGIGASGLYLVWQTLAGHASLGDLALFAQAFNQGRTIMDAMLVTFTNIHQYSLLLSNLFQFLALKATIDMSRSGTQPAPRSLHEEIAFEKVSFAYPYSDRHVFENLDITFPAGKLIAIVGSNGAGKSTLAKLLCRFYDPAPGTIRLDGVPLTEFDLNDLRSQITVIFQNPIRYDMTVAENIAISARNREISRDEIEAAAAAAGADEFIRQLPRAYDTPLGRRFGGEELSTGEWQRIALARVFLRDSPIVILDEPTSAMDPWKRDEWITHLRKTLSRRTALLITHRYTTARKADLIYVMARGKIIEQGTHEQLIDRGGSYAQLWEVEKQTEREQMNLHLEPPAVQTVVAD